MYVYIYICIYIYVSTCVYVRVCFHVNEFIAIQFYQNMIFSPISIQVHDFSHKPSECSYWSMIYIALTSVGGA